VKLVVFTSLTAPATASTIGEVSLPDAVGIADASAEAAIAAAAMLSGALVADPEIVGEAAGVGAVAAGGAVTVATAIADGSSGTSGVVTVVEPTSEVCSELASGESSEVFPDFVCFDGFPAVWCEFLPAASLSAFRFSAFRGEPGAAVAASGAASRGGSRSWREAREEEES
jgi:hypothetical protein